MSVSCSYKTDDYYSPERNAEPLPPNIQAVELNLDEDTIYVYRDMDVVFNFKSDNQEILGVKFIIDGNDYFVREDNEGEFTLRVYTINSGTHNLRLEVYTNYGSGSLADVLGMEQYVSIKEWVLIVDLSFQIEATAFIDNGLLHLAWTEYKASDFVSYRVVRSNIETNVNIAETTNTYFVDSSYVGEGFYYKIFVDLKNGYEVQWGRVTLENDIPELSFSANTSNEYKLNWNKSKFYNAIAGVIVVEGYSFESPTQTILNTSNVEDTTAIIPVATFNANTTYTIQLLPKGNNPLFSQEYYDFNYDFRQNNTFLIGYPSEEFDAVYKAGSTDLILKSGQNLIKRYSLEFLDVEETRTYNASCNIPQFNNMEISLNGVYLCAFVGCNNDDVYWGTTGDLSLNKVVNLNFINGGVRPSKVYPSDVGTALIPGGFDNDNSFYIYDFNREEVVGHFEAQGYAPILDLKISSEGEYIFYMQNTIKMLEFKNDVFTELDVELGFATDKYGFIQNEPDLFYYWAEQVFYIKNFKNNSTVNQFSLDDWRILDIDFYNGQILSWTQGHLYIRSINNGSVLYDIPFVGTPSGANSCYLLNNTIINSNEVLYFLQ